jgi:hypothetical protein
MKSTSIWWFGVLLAATTTACVNKEHLQIAKDRDALYAEWLLWWNGDCNAFDAQFDPWLKNNKDRAKRIEAAWDAIPDGEKDSLVSGLPDHAKLNKAEIEMTIQCGMAPSRLVEMEP